MIKYLGSKRTLVPVLGDMAVATGAREAVDLFTGTTRVAQELKRRGLTVTATDIATYSGVMSDCYIATGEAGLLHGHLLRGVAVFPAEERSACRRHPGRAGDHARSPLLPGPPHQPDAGC